MINSASLTSPSDIAKDGRVEPGHDEQRSVPEMMREIVGGGRRLIAALPALGLTASPAAAQAPHTLDLTAEPLGILALAIFIVGYALVVLEERLGLRKSKPVMLGAAAIWALIAIQAARRRRARKPCARHSARSSSSSPSCSCSSWWRSPTSARSRNGGCSRCCAQDNEPGFSLPAVFWLTGVIAFVASPVLDNFLTTALYGRGRPCNRPATPAFIPLA